MKTNILWTGAAILLIVNTGTTLWLVHHVVAASRPPSAVVGDNFIPQLARLNQMVIDYHTELEKSWAEPSDRTAEEKAAARDQVQRHMLRVEIARVAYLSAQRRKTEDAVRQFVISAEEGVNTARWGHYITPEPKLVSQFPNLSRLQGMENDFDVLATAVLKDLK